jgi:predicted nucleotidyltransferase
MMAVPSCWHECPSAQIDLRRLRAKREEILQCAAGHGARNARLFGSAVRGESDTTGDVDLLVGMEPGAACSI